MSSVAWMMERLHPRYSKESVSVLRGLCVLCLLVFLSVAVYPGLWAIGAWLHTALTGSYVAGRHVVLLISCPDQQVAKDIARAVMERRMAASINILPRTSSINSDAGENQDFQAPEVNRLCEETSSWSLSSTSDGSWDHKVAIKHVPVSKVTLAPLTWRDGATVRIPLEVALMEK
ncbi:hypothetical protein NHX12_026949, partial [Muraenolepis orangiensis]